MASSMATPKGYMKAISRVRDDLLELAKRKPGIKLERDIRDIKRMFHRAALGNYAQGQTALLEARNIWARGK